MHPYCRRVWPPIGIDRVEAAAYIGVSETLFDRLVAQGRMPQPRQFFGRLVWDIDELTKAFRSTPTSSGH